MEAKNHPKIVPRKASETIFRSQFSIDFGTFLGPQIQPPGGPKIETPPTQNLNFHFFHPSEKGEKQQPKMVPKDSNFKGVWKAFFNLIFRPLKGTENSQTGVWLQSGALFQAPKINFFTCFSKFQGPKISFSDLVLGLQKITCSALLGRISGPSVGPKVAPLCSEMLIFTPRKSPPKEL